MSANAFFPAHALAAVGAPDNPVAAEATLAGAPSGGDYFHVTENGYYNNCNPVFAMTSCACPRAEASRVAGRRDQPNSDAMPEGLK